jgi:hypothetical protein
MRGVLQQVVDVVGSEKAKRRYNCVTSAKDNHMKGSKCEKKKVILHLLVPRNFLWLNSPSRGGAVDGGTALQAGRSWVPFPMVSFH